MLSLDVGLRLKREVAILANICHAVKSGLEGIVATCSGLPSSQPSALRSSP